MRRLLAIAISLAASTVTVTVAKAAPSLGVWRNPRDSVHVRMELCGDRACGVVVWASEKAKADARKGGTDPLVGSQLFRDFIEESPGVWRGKVFVPDIGKTLSGTISRVDDKTLLGSGCLIGRVICKSQRWTRLD